MQDCCIPITGSGIYSTVSFQLTSDDRMDQLSNPACTHNHNSVLEKLILRPHPVLALLHHLRLLAFVQL